MRHPILLLTALSPLLACTKLDATEPPTTPPAVQCREVDTSTEPSITRYEEGGVVIHSFVTPDSSAGTASHIVETGEALVVVDTQLLRDYARQFRAYADGLGKPIERVIITHGHPDHYFGLEHFEGLPVYALPETRVDVQERSKAHLRMHREVAGECDAVTDRVRLPDHDLAVGEQMIGGVGFVFEKVADAEDDDQLVIRIPAAKTLVLQDLMATDVHAFTAAGMFDGWIASLERYAAMTEYTHVLAGHGRPVERDAIHVMIAYLEKSREIWATAKTGEALEAAFRQAYPERDDAYLLDLMVGMKFPE
jgi:glyoxylase-like metal-dependent hydrolase (beta-lactamase superfamily II)